VTALTIGVEEEFLLVDPDSGAATPAVDAVVPAIPAKYRPRACHEFHRSQLEVATAVCTDLAGLHQELVELRRAAAGAAEATGSRLLAVGTAVADSPPPDVTHNPRYEAMVERFGAIADTPGLCGCHVHVGVPDKETAVQMCNHLRPWLPVLQALTANSPFYVGRDTRYASFRSVLFETWPSTGPTPYFASAADYDRIVADLIAAGVMLDAAMVYWYARPSANYPTVEVRIGDVCATAADATLVAAIVRGLVATLLDDLGDGVPPPRASDALLRAAHWRAARDGLEGLAVDARSRAVRPCWEAVDDLVARIGPALEVHGDLDAVREGLRRLRTDGSGAARQRRAYAERGRIDDVVAMLGAATVDPG
jgi:carboxylate-amine ligase